jgi:hypothetical protein
VWSGNLSKPENSSTIDSAGRCPIEDECQDQPWKAHDSSQ